MIGLFCLWLAVGTAIFYVGGSKGWWNVNS